MTVMSCDMLLYMVWVWLVIRVVSSYKESCNNKPIMVICYPI